MSFESDLSESVELVLNAALCTSQLIVPHGQVKVD